LKDLQTEATQLLAKPEVPWSRLRAITLEFRRSTGSTEGLLLHKICHGSKLMLKPPHKREKSKELQDRLIKLQEQVDQASYNKMVSDVTKQVCALRSKFHAINYLLHIFIYLKMLQPKHSLTN
jgi:hypothetical protein